MLHRSRSAARLGPDLEGEGDVRFIPAEVIPLSLPIEIPRQSRPIQRNLLRYGAV